MKSPKETALERKLLSMLSENLAGLSLAKLLVSDEEIQDIQEYANTVAIKRLGYNDHGPVHMRQVTLNALKMLTVLHQQGIKTNLEIEEIGTYEDSLCAVMLASFLHDLGMSIGRQDHEMMSAIIAKPIISRLLVKVDQLSLMEKAMIESLALEGIVGHMATRKIHSLEAGLVLIADGCDMEKGRARIPLAISSETSESAHYGDIHMYSANSIEKVIIAQGKTRPIRVTVHMSSEVGCFQVEEVLLPKVNMSPAKSYLELVAIVGDGPERHYL